MTIVVGQERSAATVVAGLAAFCLVLQVASATIRQGDFETPNTASWIARTLVSQGEFAAGDQRAYHLPAEPLYLAAGFTLLPAGAWRYLHVPVAVLFVAAIVSVAVTIGGPQLGIVAGVVAALDPFVLAHGPVWDDTFLSASLEWILFAIVIGIAAQPAGHSSPRITLAVLLLVSGLAALTRTQSQITIAVLAGGLLLWPRVKRLRPAGGAMLAGLMIALAAWGVRNAQVLGTFQIGSTHDGKTLFESNCAYTRQGIRELGSVGHFTLDCSPAQVTHAFSLSEVESDRALRRDAIDYMTSQPWDVAKTAVFKTVVSLTGYDFRSPPLAARNVVVVAAALLLLAFGLRGLLRVWPTLADSRMRDVALLIAASVVTVTLLMLMIGPTGLRYRISLAGLLHIGIAAAIVLRAAPVTHGFSLSRIVAVSGR